MENVSFFAQKLKSNNRTRKFPMHKADSLCTSYRETRNTCEYMKNLNEELENLRELNKQRDRAKHLRERGLATLKGIQNIEPTDRADEKRFGSRGKNSSDGSVQFKILSDTGIKYNRAYI